MTQFGRMCAKLGIELIAASSPQAKGRVERSHGTHQDRLVKKLRRKEIATHAQANAYLQEEYLPEHNRRFARPAAEAGGLSPAGAGRDRAKTRFSGWERPHDQRGGLGGEVRQPFLPAGALRVGTTRRPKAKWWCAKRRTGR